MSTETRPSTPGSRPRRRLVVAAALAAFALLATGAVAHWSGDSWSEEATATGGFPGLPGGDWTSTSPDDDWASGEASGGAPAATSTTPAREGTIAPGSSLTATVPPDGTAATAATAVVEPASDPTSVVPTTRAPAPSSTAVTTPPAPPATTDPRPTSTGPGPKPRPTTPRTPPGPRPTTPAPSPSPTSGDDGCFLLIIC